MIFNPLIPFPTYSPFMITRSWRSFDETGHRPTAKLRMSTKIEKTVTRWSWIKVQWRQRRWRRRREWKRNLRHFIRGVELEAIRGIWQGGGKESRRIRIQSSYIPQQKKQKRQTDIHNVKTSIIFSLGEWRCSMNEASITKLVLS